MQGYETKRPPFVLSLVVCVGLVALFSWIRLGAAQGKLIGPTLGLPLLVCLWNRERTLLWSMTLCFTGVIFYHMFYMTPPEHRDASALMFWIIICSMLINVWVIALVCHLFIGLHDRLERRNATLEVANAYLESTNQELRERERKIVRQHEELEAKQRQIESMTRELAEKHAK